MKAFSWTAVVLATSLVALVPTPASAAPREAQEQFEQGRALLKANKPADAIPKFLASIAAEPTLAALLNLADCYERVGKLASARARFQQAQELAKDKDPVRAGRGTQARRAPRPQGVDGHALAAAQGRRRARLGRRRRGALEGVGCPAPLRCGHARDHHPGCARQATHRQGRRPRVGGAPDVPIEVDAEPAAAAAPVVVLPPPPPVDRAPEKAPDGTMRTAGIVVGVTGLVAIGVGAVTGFVALAASSDLKDACSRPILSVLRVAAASSDLDDKARTFGTVSTITFISGAALLAVGTILFVASPSTSRQGARGLPRYAGVPVGTW